MYATGELHGSLAVQRKERSLLGKAAGKGKVKLLLDDIEVGCVEVDGNGEAELKDNGCGERTLKLVFEDCSGLEFDSVILE